MAEGESTPVVEAKRLVERDDEGMSQSYHEIFDTQVNHNICVILIAVLDKE